MKGLFVKDSLILKHQWKTLAILLCCGIVMSLSMETTAVISYLTMLGGFLALGTLSYDELDNGFLYLFILPVSRKDYVIEKYLFTTGVSCISMLVGTVLCGMIGLSVKTSAAIGFGEMMQVGFIMLFVVWILDAIMLPLRIKYGNEKGRIMIYAVACIFALLYSTTRLPVLHDAVQNIVRFLSGISETTGILIAGLTAVLLLFISAYISMRIIEKKEY